MTAFRFVLGRSSFRSTACALVCALSLGACQEDRKYRSDCNPAVAAARERLVAAVAFSNRAAAEAAIADLYTQERACPAITIRVGRAWLSLGEPGKALETCNRGLGVITDGGDRYLLSRCKLDALEKLSRHPEAIAAAKEYLREDPTSSSRHLELAKLLEKDDPAEALSHVREAMLLRPVYREAYYSPEAQNEPDRNAEEMLRLYGRLQTRLLAPADGASRADAGL